MKRFVLAVWLTACGAAPPIDPSAPRSSREDGGALAIEYVAIPVQWVEKYVPAEPADVKAWGDVPENRASLKTDLRQIVVVVERNASETDLAAAKKKVDALVERTKKGEDFAKLARESSDDNGSAPNGGSLGTDASTFGDEMRKAFDSLAHGETLATPIRTRAGFHILHRDAPSEDQLAIAYRKAKAPDVAKKLADDLLARLRTPDSARAAIASAVQATLGDGAVADADRPEPAVAPRERVEDIHVLSDLRDGLVDFAKTARPGQVLDAPLGKKRLIIVARAIAR